jgi:hypothetical protein
MDSTNPHKAALSNATAFKHENPDEKASAAARIYSVNESTVRQALFESDNAMVKLLSIEDITGYC